MQAIANKLRFLRWFRDSEGKKRETELGTFVKKTKLDEKVFSNLMQDSSEEDMNENTAVDQKNKDEEDQKQLSGFLKKLIKVLTTSRYYYFIKYDKRSKSVIIPSKKDFTTYVLKCHDESIFKAASFSLFHRQMKLRGFEVIEAMIKQTPGRLDLGIGYKANDDAFIHEIADILKERSY